MLEPQRSLLQGAFEFSMPCERALHITMSPFHRYSLLLLISLTYVDRLGAAEQEGARELPDSSKVAMHLGRLPVIVATI